MFKTERNIPIYEGRLVVAIDKDLGVISGAYGLICDAKANAAFASRWQDDAGGRHYLIALTPDVSHGAIAHESKHITNYIFSNIGAMLDPENDEPECYLLGWIVDFATYALEKYKNKK